MYNIAILSGDGIGPEVMEQAVRVLKVIEKRFSLNITYTYTPVGGIAIDTEGTALPQKTIAACKQADAILFGSVGGPKWDTLPPHEQPERGALLPLRKHFDLFANLRPVIIFNTLRDVSPLKNSVLPNYLDILIVRELTGGLYFGKPKKITKTYAMDTLVYQKHEVERIAHVAFNAARKRNNHVVSVDKANVLTSMVFWRDIVSQVATQYPDVTVSHMYVDNAAMQLIVNPGQFDVLLCPNSFGDILSDEASVFAGSLGLLPSASLGNTNKHAHTSFGLYEPSGGSAPDIAGKDVANPIAQILSAAMLLKYSLGLHKAHDLIVKSIETVIDKGYRTKDITTKDSITVHTTKIGSLICDTLDTL